MYSLTSIFSPILPTSSTILSFNVRAPAFKFKSASLSAGLLAYAVSAISFPKDWNSSFLATKSVSQLSAIRTASFLSSLTLMKTEPSFASLSERDAETFWPFFLKISIAFSKSPSASVRAFLQSIIPAPVIWRSLFTSCAEIADILLVDLDFMIWAKINRPTNLIVCKAAGRSTAAIYYILLCFFYRFVYSPFFIFILFVRSILFVFLALHQRFFNYFSNVFCKYRD